MGHLELPRRIHRRRLSFELKQTREDCFRAACLHARGAVQNDRCRLCGSPAAASAKQFRNWLANVSLISPASRTRRTPPPHTAPTNATAPTCFRDARALQRVAPPRRRPSLVSSRDTPSPCLTGVDTDVRKSKLYAARYFAVRACCHSGHNAHAWTISTRDLLPYFTCGT